GVRKARHQLPEGARRSVARGNPYASVGMSAPAAPRSDGDSAPANDSATWLALDEALVGQSPYPPPLVLEAGQGWLLWHVHGRRFLYCDSGQFCMATGHGHPHVVEAVGAQAR